jgi:hypothetical protein
VAVVTAVYSEVSFQVSEEAYVAWNVVDLRTSNMQDVVGFILPPGTFLPLPGVIPPQALASVADGEAVFWSWASDLASIEIPRALADVAGSSARLGGV